jgi:hypothetical protein
VRINPRRDCDIAVAQQLRHPLDADPGLHQPASEGPPQVEALRNRQIKLTFSVFTDRVSREPLVEIARKLLDGAP